MAGLNCPAFFTMKKCTACNIIKHLNDFHLEKHGKFGVKSKCKLCVTELSQKWKALNKEREKENRKRWNATNSERHKNSTYLWRKSNYNKHLEYVNNYQKDRKKKDSKFKILCATRSLVYNHIVNRNLNKETGLTDLLKCTFDFFISHLESKFESDMNWENYGNLWSLDHICPCAQAQNEEELLKLQNFINWRPCYTHINLSKSDKLTNEGSILCELLLQRKWINGD